MWTKHGQQLVLSAPYWGKDWRRDWERFMQQTKGMIIRGGFGGLHKSGYTGPVCREALDAGCTFCFSHILVAARANKSCSLKYVFVPPILSHVITARRLFVGFCKNWLGLWQFLLLSFTSLSLPPHHIPGEPSPRQCGHRPEDKLSIFTMFSQSAFLANSVYSRRYF